MVFVSLSRRVQQRTCLLRCPNLLTHTLICSQNFQHDTFLFAHAPHRSFCRICGRNFRKLKDRTSLVGVVLVLVEIKELKKECQEETSSSFRQLPPHGRITYQDRVFPNVPLLRRSGEIIGVPGLNELLRDLSSGFILVLLGRLDPGSCCENKGFWKPEQILGKEEFFTRKRGVHSTCTCYSYR